jgi:hypothetical protein
MQGVPMPVGLITGFTQTRSKPGLLVTINGGTAVISGSVASFPTADISVGANATTYIYLNFTSGLIESSTSGFLAGAWPIAIAVTNSNSVVTLTDSRPDVFGSAGAGGTVTGTNLTSGDFITGAGSSAIQDSTFPFFLDPTKYAFFWHDFAAWGNAGAQAFANSSVIGGGSPQFVTSYGSSGSGTALISEAGSLGIVQILTGTTNGSAALVTMGGGTSGPLQAYNNTLFDAKFRIKVSSITNAQYFIGFNRAEAVGDGSTDLLGISFDSAQDGTTWHAVTRSANGAITRTNIPSNGTVSTTNYQTLRIRSLVAGTVLFSVDGGTEVAVSSGLPTIGLAPQFAVLTIAAANNINVKIDYFWHWFAITR